MKFAAAPFVPYVFNADRPVESKVDRLDRQAVARDVSPLSGGDMVLYRAENGRAVPAVLVQSAGGGCWLARDARHTQGLLYLGAENIVRRLSRVDPDLLEEAA